MALWLCILIVSSPAWFSLPVAASENNSEASRPADVITKIDVQLIGDMRQFSRWRDIANDIVSLYMKEGKPFDAADVKASLAALTDCRRFKAVHVDSRADAGGIALIYSITPHRRIKDIRIRGKYPLFEAKVLNAMTVYPGDAYIKAVVDAQVELLVALYQKEGYIDPDVVIGSWQDPADHQYILFVTINKGPYYSLGRVAFEGNRSYADDTLHWRMRSWRKATFGKTAGRYKQQVFKADLDNISKFYRKNGFFDVRVTHAVTKNADTGKVDAVITIQEGPRYHIAFQGGTAFWDRTLRKQLTMADTGNRSGIGLRKSIKNIKRLYREAGYPQARIAAEKSEAEVDGVLEYRILLKIDEGPRFTVERLNIGGNRDLKEAKLRRQILTRQPGLFHDGALVEDVLKEDLLMVRNLYHKEGYMKPEVSVERTQLPRDENRYPVVVDLNIVEGVRTVVTAVDLEGLVTIPAAHVRAAMRMKAGKPFRLYELKNEERNIAQVISEMGYPHVTVESRTAFTEDGSGVRVTFVAAEGPFVQMGRTYYSGNFRTKRRILDREIEMQPDDAFSLKQMVAGQKNIRAMNIFRSVQFRPIGLEDRREKVFLFAEVDEKPPFFFQTNAGYESEKGLYAGTRLGDHNFLGLNKDVWMGGEVSQTGYWAESRIYEPRFFGTRVSSDFGLFFEQDEPFNQTFGTRKYGADLLFSRKLTNRITTNLGFRWERRDQFGVDEVAAEEENYDQPRSIFTTTPSIAYDSRDSFMRPREGVFSFLAVDVSKGIENSFDDFYKYRFEVRGFTTPLKRMTLAAKGSFGDINPYGSKGIVPRDQLFFLGGTTTVRGFDENLLLYDSQENPVGGEMAAVASAEARFDLGRNFEFSLFYDVGYLNGTSGEEDTDNVRDSVGLGLRYVTPIGAMGVLYGHKLDPRPEESPGRFHFSVGYTF